MHHLKTRPKRFGGEAMSTRMRLQKMREELSKELDSVANNNTFYIAWAVLPRQSSKVLPKTVAVALSTFLMIAAYAESCLLYTSPSPRDQRGSRMPSSA